MIPIICINVNVECTTWFVVCNAIKKKKSKISLTYVSYYRTLLCLTMTKSQNLLVHCIGERVNGGGGGGTGRVLFPYGCPVKDFRVVRVCVCVTD